MTRSYRTRGLAAATAVLMMTAGLTMIARTAGAQGTTRVVCPSAGAGCDHTSIQAAIDASGANDTVLVRPGTYTQRLTIGVGALTVCGGEASGTACARTGAATRLAAPDGAPAVRVTAPSVRLSGIAISGRNEPLVDLAAHGAILRRNVVSGPVAIAAGVVADVRLNQWDTNDWNQVRALLRGTGSAMAAPILRTDGKQDPPRPSVGPSGHCSGMSFTPRFVEEAVWCAHANGSIVFHPSANTANPTPHGAFGGSQTITINRNRQILSVDSFGEPTFGADDELLSGLTLCSGPGSSSTSEPPPPSLANCNTVSPARQATVLDSNLGPATTLDLVAPDVSVENLVIRNTVIAGGHGQAVRIAAPGATLTGNLIDGNLAGGGDPLLNQFGVLTTGPAADYTIATNEIRNWAHGGIYVENSTAGKGMIGPGNMIFGHGRSGLLVAHQSVAARDTAIIGNTIGPNGLRGINLEASKRTIIEDNEISLDLLAIEGLATGTGAGVWVQGAADTRLWMNSMSGNDVAAVVVNDFVVGTTIVAEPSALWMRRNQLPANSLGLRIGTEVSGLIVDATRNHWGRYTRESVATAIQGASGNEVDISCFLAPNGAEICPPVPVIEQPAHGSTTTQASVTVSGSNAESDSIVTVFEGPGVRGTGSADQLGDWSTGSIFFGDGTHGITASSYKNTDGIVTRSNLSALVSFTINLPSAPVITSPFDGAIVPPNFVVTGTGPATAALRLKNGPATIATTTIDGSGNWSITLEHQVGTLSLRAFSLDGAGTESQPSNLVRVTIDASVAPAPPVIIVPFENEIVPSNVVTISGTATPGHTVEVRKVNPTPLAFLGSDVADGSGAWSIVTTLPDGIYQVRAISISGIGISSPAFRNFRVKTDFAAPLTPTILAPEEGSLNPGLVTISGEGELGTLVVVKEGPLTVAEVPVQPNGRWSMRVVMRTGEHTIHALARDNAGNASANSDSVTFLVDADAPTVDITTGDLTPFIGAPEIEGIARDNRGVARVEIQAFDVFGAEVFRGDATLVQPGATSTLWSAEISTSPLIVHTVRATAYDTVGNRSVSDSIVIVSVGG